MRTASLFVPALLATTSLLGCSPPLENGEIGNIRYFGEIPGEVPMRLLPPTTDRDGNIYVAYGARNRTDTEIWAGRASGGWNNACSGHRGSFGLHGFIGTADNEAWVWTGDTILHVWGESGTCHEILKQDPVTGTSLIWQAIAPGVRISPSRMSTTGLVRSTNSGQYYLSVIDLERETMTQLQTLQPTGVEDLIVLGTGADTALDEYLFAISYTLSGKRVDEALLLDSDNQLLRRIPLDLDTAPAEYEILGFFQSNGGGAWAGVRENGGVILIAPAGGYDVRPDFDAYGLLRTPKNLFVTGLVGSSPVAARVADNSSLEGTREWRTPELALNQLEQSVVVFDERNSPLRKTSWETSESAIGIRPLISPYPLDSYTENSAGWLFAGPSYQGPAEQITSVGFAPIGWVSP